MQGSAADSSAGETAAMIWLDGPPSQQHEDAMPADADSLLGILHRWLASWVTR